MGPFAKRASILVGGVTAIAATAGAYVLVRGVGKRPAFFVGNPPPTPTPKPTPAARPTSGVGLSANARSLSAMPSKTTRPGKPKAMPIESADPNPKPGLIGALKEIYYEFANDDVMTQAAALAFYAGLAFAPLLTVTVWVMRVFFKNDAKDKVADALSQVVGSQAAAPLKDLLKNTSDQANSGMTIAGIVSIALVAFSASGVFGQVQSALNAIWHVEAKPSNGLIGFVRKRVLSLGMLASILFLLMTSLIVSVGLQAVIGTHTGGVGAILGSIANNLVSVGLFTVLFAALFRFVPDAKIEWRPVWIGGLISAVLFTLGKFGLAIYLGKTDYSSSYGAATGSFVALLVWVYYSSVILLVGAEATEVTARRTGHALQPDDHAVRVKQIKE